MIAQASFVVATEGRGTYEITGKVQEIASGYALDIGLCHVFLHHTSASLILCENADPTVRQDLETFMSRIVPDGDPQFLHTDEGPDDMPAHVRTVLTTSDISVPLRHGRCDLGTWQGIYVWEHRHSPHRRRVTVTILGDAA